MNDRKRALRFLEQLRRRNQAAVGTDSDGVPPEAARWALEEYLREQRIREEDLDPQVRAALTDMLALGERGGVDAVYDALLPEMQEHIERAATEMKDQVGGTAGSRGWEAGQRPLVAHLTTGQLNAVSIRVPGRSGTYLVLFHDQMPMFTRLISRVLAWAIPREGPADGPSFRIDRGDPARQLRAVPEIGAWFTDIVLTYAATGRVSLRDHTLPPGHRELAGMLDSSLRYFLLGHEYAHLMLGHLDGTPTRKGVLPAADVEALAYSWRQEYQADLVGTILSINARTDHQPDFGMAFLGVSLFFDALEVMDRAVALLQTGDEHARRLGSHPPPGARKEELRRGLTMIAEADPARMGAPVRRALALDELQSEIVRLLWERTRPVLLELHRTGVPADSIWRTVPTGTTAPATPTAPAEQAVPTRQAAPTHQAMPTDQPVPTDQLAPTHQAAPTDQPAPTDRPVPAPVETPAPPVVETSFLVTEVWDLPSRDGLMTSGRTLTGKVRSGMVLRDDAGHRTSVLALEFLSPRDIATGEVTIMLERTDPSPVRVGAVLTAVA